MTGVSGSIRKRGVGAAFTRNASVAVLWAPSESVDSHTDGPSPSG